MADLLLLLGIAQSHTVKSPAHLIFGLFGRDYDVFSENVMSLQGDSPKKSGIPLKNCDFRPILSRKMLNDNQTQCNNTCFVQKFDLKPLPTPSPPPSPPPSPHLPSTTLLAPTPLPLSTTPSANNLPPPAKSKSAIKNS